MKRVLVVLLVSMVFAAASFAVDPAVINVKTTITASNPAYTLTDGVVTAGAGQTAIHTINQDDLLGASQTISFTIKQSQKSNSVVNTTITVTATDLILQNGGNDVASPQAYQKFICSTKQPTLNTATVAGIAFTNGATANIKNLAYNGQLIDVDTTIATFSCTWDQNADAAAGEYKAAVTLTVTGL